MHTPIAVRDLVDVLDPAQQVVGVQDRVLADALEPVRAEGADVDPTAEEDADVAEEAADTADRLRTVVVEGELVADLLDDRYGQVWREGVADGDRAGPRAAGPVRASERLV